MRSLFLLFIFIISADSDAQTLKDSLFGGKLKVDSALLIKSKGNPQYSKPDSIKKPETTPGPKTTQGSVKTNVSDSTLKTQPGAVNTPSTEALQNQNNAGPTVLKYQDNPKVWKKFVDEYTAIFNTEVLSSKKIKKGSFTIMLDYEIGTDGVVGTKSISCMPENDFLVEQVKERMMPNAPQLAPLIRNGVPVKSSKRQMMIFTKEKN